MDWNCCAFHSGSNVDDRKLFVREEEISKLTDISDNRHYTDIKVSNMSGQMLQHPLGYNTPEYWILNLDLNKMTMEGIQLCLDIMYDDHRSRLLYFYLRILLHPYGPNINLIRINYKTPIWRLTFPQTYNINQTQQWILIHRGLKKSGKQSLLAVALTLAPAQPSCSKKVTFWPL